MQSNVKPIYLGTGDYCAEEGKNPALTAITSEKIETKKLGEKHRKTNI